jgi:Telomere capping, CST complex subunit
VDYEVSTGSLHLEHAFPQHVLPTPKATVDVRLVLEAIKAHDLQGGSWLNIIGYVRKPEQRQKKTTRPNIDDVKIVAIPIVQAIIVWGAGAIKVPDYEAALVSQREVKGAAELPAMH